MGPVAEMEKENQRALPEQIGWQLSALMESAGLEAVVAGDDVEIKGIFDNSQKVQKDSLFVAIKGTSVDSHVFISDAVERGAKVIVVEDACPPYPGVTQLRVKNSRRAIALLSHAFYGLPSRDLTLVGITGTNGKTTCSFLLEALLTEAKLNPGLIGTIEYFSGVSRKKAFNTTPSPLEISGFLWEMVSSGCKSAAMEVSSHSIDQERIAGLNFALGLFTNISQDHLDYHDDMTDYIKVKHRFFTEFLAANPEGIGVFNMQDTFGRLFAEEFTGPKVTFGFDPEAMISGTHLELGPKGIRFRVEAAGKRSFRIESPLVGEFNAQNVLAATACGIALGVPTDKIRKAMARMGGVPGRFERIEAGQPFLALVDYSHTPAALENALKNASSA